MDSDLAPFGYWAVCGAVGGFECAFNNKFNCLHDVGKVQQLGKRCGRELSGCGWVGGSGSRALANYGQAAV